MTRDAFFERYADVITAVGLNINPGQELLVRAPLEAAAFVPHVVRSAYRRGARHVVVEYRQQEVTRVFLEEVGDERLSYVPPGTFAERLRIAKDGGAVLSLLGEDPHGLSGVDPKRRGTATKALAAASADVRELTMKDAYPWCVVSVPNATWARAVYPDTTEDDALGRLFDAVGHACRLDTEDPVAAWRTHSARLHAIARWLDEQAFDRFRYVAPGTDFSVGMPAGQHWIATESTSQNGITFIANVPTDEIFSAPDWRRAEGTIRSTRPLVIGGTDVGIADFVVRDGRIVEARAEREEEVLLQELERDERSRYFGEIALVTEDAPIAELGITFLDGLYDENAGCHFAFGAAYASCVAGGADMTPEERTAAGLNQSDQHFDFTVGSGELTITAYRSDDIAVPIMVAGRYTDEVLRTAGA